MSDQGSHPPEVQRFPIHFTGANKAMVVLGLRPANSSVDVSSTDVTIRMGWAFRASVPLTSIASVTEDQDRVLGWGVHGWRGRWLVNGSSSNLVRLVLDPPVRGRTAGIPVNVQTIRVSVDDPAGLIAALG